MINNQIENRKDRRRYFSDEKDAQMASKHVKMEYFDLKWLLGLMC